MTRSPWLWPTIVFLSAVAVGVVALGDLDTPIRPAVTFWFLAVCPGMAFVGLLRIKEYRAELALGIALSVVLDTLAAVASLYAGHWSPKGCLAALIFLTLLGAALQCAASSRNGARNVATSTEGTSGQPGALR